jgi:hypothetical protein
MKTNIGLWIDEQKAVIVLGSAAAGEVKVILAHADRQAGQTDAESSMHSTGGVEVPAEDAKDQGFGQHLSAYYDEVISCVHEAKTLLIFGPGEAKNELRARLQKMKHSGRIVIILTTSRMTEPQAVAKVHDFFRKESPVFTSRRGARSTLLHPLLYGVTIPWLQ